MLLNASAAVRRLATGRRPPDAHLVSYQGNHHAADNIPNQDAAFSLIQPSRRHSTPLKRLSISPSASQPASPDLSTPISAPTSRAPPLSADPPHLHATLAAAVFDGHGEHGHAISTLASARMEAVVCALLAQRAPPLSLCEVAEAAFKEVAAAVNASPAAADSGCTASLALVRGVDAAVAWVGDSAVAVVAAPGRGVNPRRARLRFVSPMHRVDDEAEMARVVAAGGVVRDGYVVDTDAKNVS